MDYLKTAEPKAEVKPKIKLGPTAEPTTGDADFTALSTGHNTFRPDIYRTSEGYLN